MSLRCISLFSGAGGLDYGFEAAGFETAVALDLDAEACAVLRDNRDWPVLEADISRIGTRTILETGGLRVGEAAALIGGPPCQPFSKSGYWARGDAARLGDPRAQTIDCYLRVLEESLPKTFLLENVPGLTFQGKSDGLIFLEHRIRGINERQGTNYKPHVALLNAADYGVPQLRQRVFVVGSRDGVDFSFPQATHGNTRAVGGAEPYRTAWDALGDSVVEQEVSQLALRGKWADLVQSIPEGQNYLWHTSRGGGLPLFGWRTRYWNFLLKLSPALPSWTIQAQPGPATGPFHWMNRLLSHRELQRLQTFPDDVRLRCSRPSVQRLLGNAVPSALAEALGREMAAQLLGGSKLKRPCKLIPPVRPNAPAAGRPVPVPTKYRFLVGAHPDHPGVGRGNRATQRMRSERSIGTG